MAKGHHCPASVRAGELVPTILVADDNSNIQKMVTLALKDLGITVVAVGNGEAAVKKLPDLHPDVVLADIFMPVRNGYEVCEYVKRDERFAHIPVVLLVGAFDPLDEHEVERVHADGVLKKPFVPPDPLIAMVKSLLERGPLIPAAGEAAGAAALAAAIAEPAAPSAPKLEKTQQLTPEEIAVATHQPLPAPEPESEQFGSQPAGMTIDETNSPVAFREMMGAEEEEEPEEAEEAAEEAEEAVAKPGFEASSVSGYHFPGEIPIPAAAAGAKEEAHTAEPATSHEAAAEASHEASREEEDHWGGIKDEMKQPHPEEPPIPVHFGESAPMEIITEESPEVPSGHEVKQDPALVSSAHDWMAAHPPVVTPPPAQEEASEPEFEPMRIEVESPSRAPAHPRAGSVDDTAQFFMPPSPAGKPLERIAQDLHEDAVRATPSRDMEETQQFLTSAAPPAVRAEPVSPAPGIPEPTHAAALSQSTWGRVEEVMLPAAPVIAAAAAEWHAHAESAAPEPYHAESAPASTAAASPTPATSPGTGTGPDLLIASITQKVMDQLDSKTIERLSRELVRPLIEALIRREIDKD
jgi:CheY-like chemotaxis protein